MDVGDILTGTGVDVTGTGVDVSGAGVDVSGRVGLSWIVDSGCDIHPQTSKLSVPIKTHTIYCRVIGSPLYSPKATAPVLYR